MTSTTRTVALHALLIATTSVAPAVAQHAIETERTVCGTVQKVSCEEKGSRLTTLELTPKSEDLPVTILPVDRLQFTPRPEDMYGETEVCATGRVQARGGRRLLIVSRPEDVQIRKRFRPPDLPWRGPYFTQCDDGVVSPVLVTDIKPRYTSRAMEAGIEGVVALEAVVRTDGMIGEIRLRTSLDPQFGLDQEAARVVKEWRFRPATRFGQPVPIRVEIDVPFRLKMRAICSAYGERTPDANHNLPALFRRSLAGGCR
jgi:TonB family protein